MSAQERIRTQSAGLDLEGLILRELDRFGVPGLELVIVKEGEVLVTRGFGRRDVARDLPVTSDTLFNHGSTGKAFTAFLIGTLVDDGVLAWDGLVRDYLADFQLADPFVAGRVTIRDLLSHRTGLPRHEWAWVANPSLPRAELVRRLRFLKLNADLRQQWQYSNLAYATAGHVVSVVTGSTWEEQLRRRIFEPLGMNSTVTSIEEQEASDNASRAYAGQDEVVEIPFRRANNIAPAGQVISCATDIARWVMCHAERGIVDGTRIIDENTLKEIHTLQMSTGTLIDSPLLPHTKFYGYGLGWLVGTYRGQEWIWHNGGIDGFRTEMAIIPKARIGVAICANLHESPLPFALLHHVLDEVLGLDPRPWADEFFERLRQARDATQEPSAAVDTQTARPLSDYAGDYEHPGYGRVEVSVDGNDLRFMLGELDLDSNYRHFDTWNLAYPVLSASWPASFNTDAEGTISEIVIPLEPALEPIRFRRSPK